LKRLIDLESRLDLRIDQIIRAKGYADFQHFAMTALENQVIAETENSSSWKVNNTYENKNFSEVDGIVLKNAENLFKLHSTSVQTLESPSDNMLVGKLLWGQYYRYFPVKFAARLLANISTNKFPSLSEFIETAVSSALLLRKNLNRIDSRERNVFGEKLSAGFPDGTEKSIRRFREHFLVSIRRGVFKIDGMLARTKLASVIAKDGDEFIGLTDHGKKFAELHSHILDEGRSPALSEDEREFLSKHILCNLPNEADHITTVLNFIKSNTNTRHGLNISLRDYYEKYFDGTRWSDAVVNTMRVGLLGRLLEMGLIGRKKKGKNISYEITDRGEEFVQIFSLNNRRDGNQLSDMVGRSTI
jgi:hypothetical protein